MKKEYDAIAFENSVVDYTANVDDNFLEKFGLKKGDWKSIKKELQKEIEKSLEGKIVKSLGGSASNTIAGMNNLGSKVVYCGTVGDDDNGDLYKKILESEGIKEAVKTKKGNTGVAITAITPEGERSFAINMSVSGKLKPKDIPKRLIKKSKILHTTCYALEQAPDAIIEAVKYAKKYNTKVSIDLGSPATIMKNREKIEELIKYSDIIFANESEAKELTGKNPEEALDELSKKCEIAVIKLGKEGSIVKSKKDFFRMYGLEVDVVNTNGAGDAFAAGFLNSLCSSDSLVRASLIGTVYAAKVVQVEGARITGNKQKEKEVKIELPSINDADELRNLLIKSNAVYDDTTIETNIVYDVDKNFDNGDLLRLRVDSSGFKITFKGKKELSKGIKTVQEIEVKVKDKGNIMRSLENSGFKPMGSYRKYREFYAYGNAKFMLDHIEGKHFVEIEAENDELIISLMGQFGLSNFKREERSYAKMFLRPI